MVGPASQILSGEREFKLRQGAIDLVLSADGPEHIVDAAFEKAHRRFRPMMIRLREELDLLRQQIGDTYTRSDHPVARRMIQAVFPHRDMFVTPMAARGGAIADYLLSALTEDVRISRAYVRNSGDIALGLSRDETVRIGIMGSAGDPGIVAEMEVTGWDDIGGVATSGWRGRGASLGIADAVTVFARTAAKADVAATLIANEVNLPGSDKVWRQPASQLSANSDLGDRLVTTLVKPLNLLEKDEALTRGVETARDMQAGALIEAAVICLQGEMRIIAPLVDPSRLAVREAAPGWLRPYRRVVPWEEKIRRRA